MVESFFKRCTLKGTVQERPISAVQLLAGGKSVTHVAFDLGFESVSSFIFSFRHYFGDSPGQYRLKQTIDNTNSKSSIQ